jgi:hypothetical protein
MNSTFKAKDSSDVLRKLFLSSCHSPFIYPLPKFFSASDCRVSFNFCLKSLFFLPWSFLFFSLEFIVMLLASSLFILFVILLPYLIHPEEQTPTFCLTVRYCLLFHLQSKCGQSDLLMGQVTRNMLHDQGLFTIVN